MTGLAVTGGGPSVGALVALVVVVLAGRPRTRDGGLRAGRRGAGGRGWRGGRDDGRAVRAGRPGRRARRTTDGSGGGLGEVLVGVAAALRSGATPAAAWTAGLAVPVRGSVPYVTDLAPAGATAPARAVVAAAQVADELGAPLAGVLDRVAEALAADDEAAADVAAAVAGPRASARVLGWLPVLAALLGAALGADLVGAVRRGGLPAAAIVAGMVLTVVGRAWSAALIRRAERTTP